jgi:hypothetical protein
LLAQANYENALDSFGNKVVVVWTDKTKRKDPTSPMFDDLPLV